MSLPSSARSSLLAWAGLTVVYSSLSMRRHAAMMSGGYDLGIFEQIAKSWAHLEIPVVPIVDNARLAADHFSPILALLGPPYALFPSAYTLLFIQAALIASGVIPLMLWANRDLGKNAAWIVALIYGLGPGLTGTAWYDFHEVAFAVPLVSWSVCALGQGRYRSAALWSLPLVLVKEDLGLTVALIGLFIFARGSRQIGALTFVYGTVWTAVTVKLILPAISVDHGYYYRDSLLPGGLSELLDTIFEEPALKTVMIVTLLIPTAFYALRSPLIVLILPTLAWRLSLDVVYFWWPATQYDAVLVPIIVAAFIDGLSRTPAVVTRQKILVTSTVLTLATIPVAHLAPLFQPSFWRNAPKVSAGKRLLDEIPDRSTVAASNQLIPHLTGRTTTYLFGDYPNAAKTIQPSDWRSADWIIIDSGGSAATRDEVSRQFDKQLDAGFVLVDESRGIRLARRR